MSITVPLTQDKVAQIDDCDADRVLPFKWFAARARDTFYAHRAQLAEKILLALISNYNDPLRDCTREDRAEYAVREADALIAALERK